LAAMALICLASLGSLSAVKMRFSKTGMREILGPTTLVIKHVPRT